MSDWAPDRVLQLSYWLAATLALTVLNCVGEGGKEVLDGAEDLDANADQRREVGRTDVREEDRPHDVSDEDFGEDSSDTVQDSDAGQDNDITIVLDVEEERSTDAADADSSPGEVGCSPTGGPKNVLVGSFTVENQVDLEFVAAYTEITGQLEFLADGLLDVELPLLEVVGGRLRFGRFNSTLRSISLPALRQTGRLEIEFMDSLASISMPCLTETEGTFELEAIPQLETFRLPQYRGIKGERAALFISTNESLRIVELPALERVDENLSVARNPELRVLDFGALEFVGGSFNVWANPSLPNCLVLQLLERLEDLGFAGSTDIRDNDETATCP